MISFIIIGRNEEKHIENCIGKINTKVGKTVIDTKYYNVMNSPTSANLSIKMFKQLFLTDTLYQSPDQIIKFERCAYKGGRTEV